MKRLALRAVLAALALSLLGACSSSHEEERRAARHEREMLHEERQELREDRANAERDCAVNYNTCVARCDLILSSASRSICISDCATIRAQCLGTK